MNALARLFGRQPAPDALVIGGAEIPLALARNARAKRISMKLCPATRSVRVTLPARASTAQALAFVEREAAWLERQMALRWPPPAPFVPGAIIPLGDAMLELRAAKGRRTVRDADALLVPDDSGLFAARTLRWLKAESLRTLEPPTHTHAHALGKAVTVRVGDAATRWGSCTSSGRIAYNWRLIMAPTFVQASVIAHEAAHLLQPNHSPAFWTLATTLLGTSHRPARAWLAANGPMLHAQGAER